MLLFNGHSFRHENFKKYWIPSGRIQSQDPLGGNGVGYTDKIRARKIVQIQKVTKVESLGWLAMDMGEKREINKKGT